MVTQQIPQLDPDQPVADQLDTLMLGDPSGTIFGRNQPFLVGK